MRKTRCSWFAAGALLIAGSPLPAQVTWITNPANGHFYALTPVSNWTDAEALAETYGGHLATVRNVAENQWLATTFATGTTCLWIGFNDAVTEGTFAWTSGEPVTFTNWLPPEPTNGNGVEDWVHLTLPWGGASYNATWNDAPNSDLVYGWPARGIMEVSVLPPGASFMSFGTGCPGPSGAVPMLEGVAGSEPRLGQTALLRVSNLPQVVTLPVFVIGLSNTWDPDGYALPVDLGVLGWPGCPQLVADQGIYWTLTATGQADQGIAIPPDTPLGLSFYVQALVLYSSFPPQPGDPVAVSNGVTGTVGF